MVPERDVDPASMYERERHDFVSFLQGITEDDIATPVPATPAWSVHDVLAHLVGITADLNAQRFGAGDSDAWTALQIEARRVDSIEQLADEWEREAPTFAAGLRLFGYDFGAHYLGDLLQHVGDVHVALGRSPERDDIAVAVALDFYLGSFEESLEQSGAGAVDVQVGDEHWRLGRGPLAATVVAERYELFRSLGGRRTLDEIRALQWTGDREAIVGLVSSYPVPDRSLHEPRIEGPR
jgi:uncharacterized protein (TIGR03083 family)